MTKIILQDQVWAGTEASLSAHLQQMEAAESRISAGFSPDPQNPDDELPYMLTVDRGIGTVAVRGPLTNRNESWLKYFGISSYSAIREALVFAASSPDVKQILLDIDSGGGAVSGVADVGALIQTINSQVKPVVAFTDGTMASAAYWLGSSAGKVYASKVAMVGSIGVISTHMEYSKALKENGVGVTVMRAGKYKALVNSVEPLTDTAKAQLQETLDAAYQVFVAHVAEARKVSYDTADQQMAQGREFFGVKAVSAGLVDGIETFDSLFSRMSNDAIDKGTHVVENRTQFRNSGIAGSTEVATMAGRQALTEQQIAGQAEAAAGAGGESAETETAASEATADSGGGAAQATSGNDQLVSYLQEQVKVSNEALVKGQVQIATLTEKLASAEAVVGDLTAIAAKSLNTMQVALGGTAIDLSTQSPLSVVTEHKRVSAQFMDKFKAGGVAAVDAAQAESREPEAMSPMAWARLAATQFSSK